MRRSLIGTNSNYDSIYYHLLQKRKGIEKNKRLKELRGLKICVSRTRMIDSSSSFTKKKKAKRTEISHSNIKESNAIVSWKGISMHKYDHGKRAPTAVSLSPFCSPVFENRGYNQLFPISCIRSTFSSLFYDQLFPPPLPPPSPLCEEKTGRRADARSFNQRNRRYLMS